MKAKILQKKEDNKPSAFEHDISLKDAKSLKVELSSFVYNDFNPDSDEYEEQEVSVKKSDVKFKIKNNIFYKEGNGEVWFYGISNAHTNILKPRRCKGFFSSKPAKSRKILCFTASTTTIQTTYNGFWV